MDDLWDLLEKAWGLIANAGHGDWAKESEQWQIAAARWRALWHQALDRYQRPHLLVQYTRPCSWCGKYGCEHPNPFMTLTVCNAPAPSVGGGDIPDPGARGQGSPNHGGD